MQAGRNDHRVRLWQSLSLRLPFFTALLFAGVLSTYLFFSHREVRTSLVRAAEARATAAANQIAGLFTPGAQQRTNRLRQLASDPVLTAFVTTPTPENRARVETRLQSEATVAPQRFEVWTTGGERLID